MANLKNATTLSSIGVAASNYYNHATISNNNLNSNAPYMKAYAQLTSNPEIKITDKSMFFKQYNIPGDFIYLDKEGTLKQVAIKEIIFNDPVTIVFWDDDTKTVCKTLPGDVYDTENGLVRCIIKKLYGATNMRKVLKTWVPAQKHIKGTPLKVTYKDARKNIKNK